MKEFRKCVTNKLWLLIVSCGVLGLFIFHGERKNPFSISENTVYGETRRVLQDRRNVLKKECSQISTKQNLQGRFFPNSVTISEQDGIAWCRIGKVGTHAWSALFLLLRGVKVPEIKDAIKELKTHTLMKKFYALNPKKKIKYLRERDLFKFIVVRHPFQRLVSGYRDKLENSSEYNMRYRDEAASMVDNITRSGEQNPTFSEFVDYLIKTDSSVMDKHWAPYSEVCLPCSVNYDAVIKLETLSQDSRWIFHQLNLTTRRQDWEKVTGTDGLGVHVGPGGRGIKQTSNLATEYFKTISKDKILKLYKKYELDFRLFDYSLSEFFK